MRLQEHGAPRGDLASPTLLRLANPLTAVASFVDKTLVIAELEARKLRHDPTELITRAVWLSVGGYTPM